MDLRQLEEERDYGENMDRIDRIAWAAAVVVACVLGMAATAVSAWLWS